MTLVRLHPLSALVALTLVGCSGATVPEASSSESGSDTSPTTGTDTLGAVCGDGVAEASEVCDGLDLGNMGCGDVGSFVGGTLACAADCSDFDTSMCEADPSGPVVVFNEVSSQDVTEGEFAGTSDAVEFFNAGAATADLSGWALSDDDAFPEDKTYVFPPGTTLEPGAFLVRVKLDEETGEGDLPFGISGSNPETLSVADASGSIVDAVSFEGPDAAVSWCRVPDGDGVWGFCTQTFGASNSSGEPQPEPVCGNGVVESGEDCDGEDLDGESCADVGDFDGGRLACTDDCTFDTDGCEAPNPAAMVVLNEFSASSPDPIELYNASDEDIDLGGWVLTDELADPRDRYDIDADPEELVFEEGTVLEAGAFMVIEQGDAPDHPFGLSGGGDAITLMDADLVVVDFVAYGDGEAADSYCRLPDGPEGDWTADCTPTFGDENGS